MPLPQAQLHEDVLGSVVVKLDRQSRTINAQGREQLGSRAVRRVAGQRLGHPTKHDSAPLPGQADWHDAPFRLEANDLTGYRRC
jgi:hypothetical protein